MTAVDLPDTAWLLVAGKHLAELTGMSMGESAENLAYNQVIALAARSRPDGHSYFDVAEYAALHEVA